MNSGLRRVAGLSLLIAGAVCTRMATKDAFYRGGFLRGSCTDPRLHFSWRDVHAVGACAAVLLASAGLCFLAGARNDAADVEGEAPRASAGRPAAE